MNEFTIYGKPSCPFCERAKALLEVKDLNYKYVDVSKCDLSRQMLIDGNFKTVPQIYHNGIHVGGFTDLRDYLSVIGL